jgi:hypothetical protein
MYRAQTLGGALALLAETPTQPGCGGRQEPAASVFITGPHGDALVPVPGPAPRTAPHRRQRVVAQRRSLTPAATANEQDRAGDF